MIPGLRDDQAVGFHPIDQPMLLVDSLRPPTRQLAAQGFGFAGSAELIASALPDQT
jgi:hypothetical protein